MKTVGLGRGIQSAAQVYLSRYSGGKVPNQNFCLKSRATHQFQVKHKHVFLLNSNKNVLELIIRQTSYQSE